MRAVYAIDGTVLLFQHLEEHLLVDKKPQA